MKQYYIYIITNKNDSTLYIGVTNDLLRRTFEHKEKLIAGFSNKYSLGKLVYYEIFDDPENAIKREKQLKGRRREWKDKLICDTNPGWKDLYDEIIN